MKCYQAVPALLCAAALLLTGCTQISIAEEERLRSTTTAVVETVVVEVEVPPVAGAETPTVLPTSGPTTTPAPTALPTAIPLPPTPAPDPALVGFSLCDQVAGDPLGGRFSARVTAITTTVEAKFERIEIGLDVPDSSVAPHALARCLSAADASNQAGGAYTLLVGLDDWLHDDLFRASTVSPTITISGTTAISGASYRVPQNVDAGADIAISLAQPLPYKIALAQNPTRLVIDIAKSSSITDTSDLLTQPAGTDAQPPTPLYYLQDGDVWSYDGGQATNLTESFEVETALAVSVAAKQIAFCRVETGAAADAALAASSLWTMALDGSDAAELAAPGRTCADPAFSPDGAQIAFTVDEGSATPPRLSIYTVPTNGSDANRLASATDEWSRFAPQWLDDDRIVYAALAEDSRSTVFINADGAEEDIGAALTVGSAYTSLGRPLAAPDGSGIAVEAIRAEGGSSLLLLDTNGAQRAEIATGYATRPLTFAGDGKLYYLSTECASSVAQNYRIFRRGATGGDTPIGYGTTLGGFGQFATSDDTLSYVALGRGLGPSALWAWDIVSGNRAKLVESPRVISGLVR